jgi:hypothetical protein
MGIITGKNSGLKLGVWTQVTLLPPGQREAVNLRLVRFSHLITIAFSEVKIFI